MKRHLSLLFALLLLLCAFAALLVRDDALPASAGNGERIPPRNVTAWAESLLA